MTAAAVQICECHAGLRPVVILAPNAGSARVPWSLIGSASSSSMSKRPIDPLREISVAVCSDRSDKKPALHRAGGQVEFASAWPKDQFAGHDFAAANDQIIAVDTNADCALNHECDAAKHSALVQILNLCRNDRTDTVGKFRIERHGMLQPGKLEFCLPGANPNNNNIIEYQPMCCYIDRMLRTINDLDHEAAPSEAKSDRLDRVFFALSDPVRRAILERLDRETALVSELAAPFEMSVQAVSRHIQVLVRAGLVEQERTGRIARCRLDAHAVFEAAVWISRYTKYWQQQFDELASLIGRLPAADGEGVI